MECPYCASTDSARVPYANDEFHFCRSCGVVFKQFSQAKHMQLRTSHYSLTSWGRDKEASLMKHGPSIKAVLDLIHQRQKLSLTDSYLDIGAGIGVLEHYLTEMLGTKDINMSPLEPVAEIANFLQQDYPKFRVINKDLETFATTSSEKFDVIFCMGVDYLFRNLTESYQKIAQLGQRRWVFSRNVFLEMEAYYASRKIQTFQDLVAPNRLIGTFMSMAQYLEMMRRFFNIDQAHTLKLEVPKRPPSSILLIDCSASPQRPANPIRNPDGAAARLAQLGVPVR